MITVSLVKVKSNNLHHGEVTIIGKNRKRITSLKDQPLEHKGRLAENQDLLEKLKRHLLKSKQQLINLSKENHRVESPNQKQHQDNKIINPPEENRRKLNPNQEGHNHRVGK